MSVKNEFIKRLLTSVIIGPIIIYITIKGNIIYNTGLFIIFILSLIEWLNLSYKNLFFFIAGKFFLIFSFYSMYILRGKSIEELLTFIFIIVVCIGTDAGGYIFGKILKGPKLTKISPNKTYSGLVGSYVTSLACGFFFVKYFNLYNFKYDLIFIILFISSISQIGDLLISFIKRVNKIKNTGKVLPGHGGILDRIDGVIFVMPFYFILFF